MKIRTNTTCGKAGYSTYTKAQQQIARALKTRKLELRQYHCKRCGSYHLTGIVDFNKHVMDLRKEEQELMVG